jgi:hypothetical protein
VCSHSHLIVGHIRCDVVGGDEDAAEDDVDVPMKVSHAHEKECATSTVKS